MDLISYLNERKIVCPSPHKWNDWYQILYRSMMPTYIKQPRSLATSDVFEKFNLKPPLILSGWNSKMMRNDLDLKNRLNEPLRMHYLKFLKLSFLDLASAISLTII